MNCRFYEKFSLGKITKKEFEQHLKHCTECQRMVKQDEKIESLVRDIKTVFHPDKLWKNIESSVITEQGISKSNSNVYRMTFKIMRAAAVLIIILLAGVIIKDYLDPQPPLLSDNSLQQYINEENICIQTIEDLEKNVQFSLNNGNIDQQLRYKEYLETVNSQIIEYYQALDKNPANTHIRNYLIQALKDKKQVLEDFVHSQRNS